MLSPHERIGSTFAHPTGVRRFFSFTDIESLALLHRREVAERQYLAIVALLRGGAYLGAMLSQFAGLPLHVARLDRATLRVNTDVPRAPAGGRLLLVEDVAGRGFTLVTVKAALEAMGWTVDTFVVAYDGLSRLRPDFGVRLNAGERYVFPWERGVLAGDFAIDRTTADPDIWSVGHDLDGVFLADVPADLYARDLSAALSQRDALSKYDAPPDTWVDGGTLITGRLECDRERTEAWLVRNDIVADRLLMRPSLEIEPAVFKADCIAQVGLTEFVESDAAQASVIARLVPYCVVWHYDGVRGVRRRVA